MKQYHNLSWHRKTTLRAMAVDLNLNMHQNSHPDARLISMNSLDEAKSDLADLWLTITANTFTQCFRRRLETDGKLMQEVRAHYLKTLDGLDFDTPFEQLSLSTARMCQTLANTLPEALMKNIEPGGLARWLDNLTHWYMKLPLTGGSESSLEALLCTYASAPAAFPRPLFPVWTVASQMKSTR